MNVEGFTPGRARLARELKEWSQADLARELGVTPAAVSQFESGVTRPAPQVRTRLAGLLDVPESFFGLPLAEAHEGFFRSLRRTSAGHRRRARALAQIAHDLVAITEPGGLPARAVPRLPVSGLNAERQEVELIAETVRRRWNVPAGPLDNVVELLESKGVIVMRLPLDSADVDAFSLPYPDWPVVVLGSDKNDRARSRFDAAHELGHLVAHGDEVWGVKQVETQAHAFAAALLMPAKSIIDELPERVDWPLLFDLKVRWQVSLAALLMRARTLGRMSEASYLTAIKAASARGWRRIEPVPLGSPEQPRLLPQMLEGPGVRAAAALPSQVLASILDAVALDQFSWPDLRGAPSAADTT